MARQVIVCTPYLERYARGHAEHVTNISSTIDTDAYVPRGVSWSTDGVVIGWSGSHSTSPYLHLLDDVLPHLEHRDPVARETAVRTLAVLLPATWALAPRWAALPSVGRATRARPTASTTTATASRSWRKARSSSRRAATLIACGLAPRN